ncbi:MAG: metallophosphoesterase [Candidatus Omnitrophica bacterium]|nr:metallophosphoesterase [Candidatus Omnitrophota bacterium]
MDKKIINILHLSDLHFGAEKYTDPDIPETARDIRKNALDNLKKYLVDLPAQDKPDIIVVTGDIAWAGKKEDYREAKKWFDKLLPGLGLKVSALCFVPGNHDLDRSKVGASTIPSTWQDADKELALEKVSTMEDRFAEYGAFCKKMGISPYKVKDQTSFYYGIREISGLKLLALNSAWYHFKNEPYIHGRLWLGLPQLQVMNANKQISDQNYDTSVITLALFHHPEKWFHGEETTSYPGRPATCGYLSMRCHLMLSGHTHCIPDGWWDRKGGGAWQISTGASYEDSKYRNNCLLLKIDKRDRKFSCRIIEYHPESTRDDSLWQMRDLRMQDNQWVSLIKNEKTKKTVDAALLRKIIGCQMEDKLEQRLNNTDYVQLQLEKGEYKRVDFEERESSEEKPLDKPDQGLLFEHKRQWQPVRIGDILQMKDREYILSSPVGMGKTTFIYWLAREFIEKTDKIPFVLNCYDIETGNVDSVDDIIEHRSGSFVDYAHWEIDQEQVRGVLKNHYDRLVLLFDGLDQITSGDYVKTVEKITKIAYANNTPFIITSRPSAVIAYETSPDIAFIRLQSFSINDQKKYYGTVDYERAKNIARLSPELTRIPMLAYMVKRLITTNKDAGVSTRTQVYERFINHILTCHPPNRELASQDFDTDENRDVLGRIAFESLDRPVPQIQKISKSVCQKCLVGESSGIEFTDLDKYGLVNLIIESSASLYLYFTHQSFQEFLAAEYAAKNDEFVNKIIREQWNPKWKETIKFLAGIQREKIVKRIFPDKCKDNIIHSRLFLAAECAIETEISDRLRNRLLVELKDASDGVFLVSSLVWRGKIDDAFVKNIAGMLEDHGCQDCLTAVEALGNLANKVDTPTVEKIAGMLEDTFLRDTAAEALASLANKVDTPTVEKIAGMLENPCLSKTAAEVLGRLLDETDKVDEKIVKKIAVKLEDWKDGSGALYRPCWLLKETDKADEKTVRWLAGMLEQKAGLELVVQALGFLADKVDTSTVKKIAGMLESDEGSIRPLAVEALGRLADKVDTPTVKKIAGMLESKEAFTRSAAVEALGRLGDKLDEKIVKKIVRMLDDKSWRVRSATIIALCSLVKYVSLDSLKYILRKSTPLLKYKDNKNVFNMLRLLYETGRPNKEKELRECWGLDFFD